MSSIVRRFFAWTLTFVLAFTPVMPVTFAEEGTTPTITSDTTPVPTPTATPVITATPTQEVTAAPDATEGVVPTPTATPTEDPSSTDPSEAPTADPSDEPAVDPTEDPSAEPSAEPSLEPSPESSFEPMDALLTSLDLMSTPTYTISSSTATLQLLSGNYCTWSINRGEYKGILTFTVETDDDLPNTGLTAQYDQASGAVLRAGTVQQIRKFKVTAKGDSTCENSLELKVQVLPKPTNLSFKDLSSSLKLSLSQAEGFSFKEDAGNLRYTLVLPASVEEKIEDDDYADMILFESSNSKVPINKNTGVISDLPASIPVGSTLTSTIKMMLKDSSTSVALSTSLTLTITTVPKKITITDGPFINMVMGTKRKLNITLADENNNPIVLTDGVEVVSDNDSVVSVFKDNITLTAEDQGATQITVIVKNTDPVVSAKTTVSVQGVPLGKEEVELQTKSGFSVDEDESKPLLIGKGETLTLNPTLIGEGLSNDKYLGAVTAASANTSHVTVSIVEVNGKKAVNLKGIAISKTDLSDDPIPTNVTITINGDLANSAGPLAVKFVLPVVVVIVPTKIELSHTTNSLVLDDSFVLKITPTPNVFARYTVEPNAAGIVTIKELAADADEPNVARFEITGKKTGTVTLTVKGATSTTPNQTCTVTVIEKPTTFTVEGAKLSAGQQYTIRPYYGTSTNPVYGQFEFSVSSPTDLIELNENSGLVTVKEIFAPTTVTVVVKSKVYPELSSQNCVLQLYPAPNSIDFGDLESVNLSIGESVTLRPILGPNAQVKANLEFSIAYINPDDPDAAAVVAASKKENPDGMSVVIKGEKAGVNLLTVKTYSKFLANYPSVDCTIPIRVGTKPTGISSSKQTMGLGETYYPTYKLSPATSIINGVFYQILPMEANDLIYFDANGNPAVYTQGKAVTDDQLNEDNPASSISGNYEGTYIKATALGRIKVNIRPSFVRAGGAPSVNIYIDIKEPPTGIKFADKTQMKLLTGMTATRQALLEPSTATGTIVYWSSDPVVATVSGTGKVTAGNLGVNDDDEIRTGKATIYARYQGNPSIVDEYEVAVSNAPTLIAFRPESLEIGIGETLEFGKDINVNFPGEGDELYDIEPPLTFSNKSTAALTLTTSGGVTKVTGKALSSAATVVVTAPNGVIANAEFKVLAKPYKIAFDTTAATVGEGETLTLAPKIYKNATTLAGPETRKALHWTTSNDSLATITVNEAGAARIKINDKAYTGTVKTVTITAVSVCNSSLKATCVLTIKNKPTAIKIDQTAPFIEENISTLSMALGTSITIKPYVFPSDAGGFIAHDMDGNDAITQDTADLEKDSPDPTKVVYMKESAGKFTFTALSPGNVTIVFTTYGGIRKEFVINVRQSPEESDVEDLAPMILAVGMSEQIKPKEIGDYKADFHFYSTQPKNLSVNESTGVVKVLKAVGDVTVMIRWPHIDEHNNKVTCEKEVTVTCVAAPTAIRLNKRIPGEADDGDGTPNNPPNNLATLELVLSEGDDYTFDYYYLPNTNIELDRQNHAMSKVTLSAAANNNGSFYVVKHKENDELDGGKVKLHAYAKTTNAISFTLTTLNGKTATVKVTVKEKPKDIYIDPKSRITLGAGRSIVFKGHLEPEDRGGEIYFEADPNNALIVDAKTGKVTVKNDNADVEEVNVYAISTSLGSEDSRKNGNNVCTVRALRAPNPDDIRDFTVRKGTELPLPEILCVGDSITASCVFPDEETCEEKHIDYDIFEGTKVTFSVDPEDKSYLSVSSAGVIKVLKLKPGGEPVRMYAKADTGAQATFMFTIKSAPTALNLSFTDDSIRTTGLKIAVGEEKALEDLGFGLSLSPIYLTENNVTIKASSSSSCVKIIGIYDEDAGKTLYTLKAVKGGTATITFSTYNGKKASFKVYSLLEPQEIVFSCGNNKTIRMGEGTSLNVTATLMPKNAYVINGMKFTSSSGSVIVTPDDDDNAPYEFTITADSLTEKPATISATLRLSNGLLVEGKVSVMVLPGPDSITIDGIRGGNPATYGDDDLTTLGVGEKRTIYYTVISDEQFDPDRMIFNQSFAFEALTKGAAVKWGSPTLVSTSIDGKERQYKVVVEALRSGSTGFGEVAFYIKNTNIVSDPVTFTVYPAATKVLTNLPGSTINMYPGKPLDFKVGIEPSSTKQYFTVSKSGSLSKFEIIGLDETYYTDEQTVSIKAKDEFTSGSCKITIKTYNGKSLILTFNIKPSIRSTDKVKLSSSATTVAEGYSGQLKVTLPSGRGTSDIEFVEVDSNGNDIDNGLGLDPTSGRFTPTAKMEDRSRICYAIARLTTESDETVKTNIIKITVKPGPKENPLPTQLNGVSDITIGKGESVSMSYQQSKPKYSYTTAWTYYSDTPEIATYSSGKIKGVAPKWDGEDAQFAMVELRAKNGLKSDPVNVTVLNAPTSVKLVADDIKSGTLELTVGEVQDISDWVTLPDKSASYKITYSSSKSSVVKVNADGELTAVKAGSATITVKTFNGKSCKLTVKVVNP